MQTGFQRCFLLQNKKFTALRAGGYNQGVTGIRLGAGARTISAHSIIIRRVPDATELELGRFSRIVS